jgi:hypothetical protein
MVISQSEQEQSDFDWFAVDEDGHVGHFTTAGFKHLPASVAKDAEDLQFVTKYFTTQAPIRCGHAIDDCSLAQKVHDWKGIENESRYLSGFISIADKGLFSYDIDTYVVPDLSYFRVASPLCPVNVRELPADVQRVVQRTKLHGFCFLNCALIAYDSTLAW